MRRVVYAPWSGSPGVIAFVQLGNILDARAGAASFSGAGAVSAPSPVHAILAAAAQPARSDDQASVIATARLSAVAPVATFAGAAKNIDHAAVPAVAQAATFAGAGTVSAATTATDPLTIVTSHPWQFFYTAETGYATGTWTDQTASALNATQATGANQPTLVTGTGPNGKNFLQFDGTNDNLAIAGWNPNAPGTTNMWFFAVLRQNNWTNGRGLYGCSATTLCCLQNGTTPNLCGDNATAGPSTNGATVGSWCMLEQFFNNATTDYTKAGGVDSGTGTNTGNTNAGTGTFRIGSAAASSLYVQEDIVCFGCVVGGKPSSTEITNLKNWVTSRYGAGVLV